MNLENVMLDAWEEIKEPLGFPNLKNPKIVEGSGTAAINMDSKEISVYSDFIMQSKIHPKNFFRGVLSHEANHYVTLPYDLKTKFLMDFEAAKVSLSKAQTYANYFNDVVINLDLINRGISDISLVYQDMESDSALDNTLKLLYTNKTGLDFGPNEKSDVHLAWELEKLDYSNLEIKSLRKNCYKFAKLIHKVHKKKDKPIGQVNFDNKIDDRTLSEVVGNLTPDEFKSFVAKNEGKDLVDYYDLLSRKYSLTILPSGKLDFTGSTSLREWEPGQPVSSIDYFKSKGKFMPGITLYNKEIRSGVESFEVGLPSAMVLIDTSGSMDDPSYTQSQAVIAGFCVANHYLNHKKDVSVVNFSTQTNIHDYSNEKRKVLENIYNFQNGGTYLDLKKIAKTLKENTDIYMFSDMGIFNFDEVLSYFNKVDGNINFFNIGFEDSFELNGRINIYNVSSADKIPNLVLNSLKR